MNIVFGGSFNPPTIAHLEIIKALCSMDYDKVIIVPNGNKYNLKDMVSFDHREMMLKIMTKGLKNIEISKIEEHNNFKGTVETLRNLNHPVFAMGDDSLINIKSWINFIDLLEENCFLVFTRNHKIEDLITFVKEDEILKSYLNKFKFVKIDFPSVSSSLFRKTKDKSLVTNEVFEYITENNLY